MQGGDAQTESCRAHTALGLQGLSRVLEATRLLPPGHPAISRAAGAGAADLRKALAQRANLQLTIAPDAILLDESEIENGGLLRPLAQALHAMDLMAVELQADLTADSLTALAGALEQARQGRLTGSAAAGLINSRVSHVHAVPSDYSALRLAHGAGRSTLPQWRDLARTVYSSLCAPDVDPAELARRMSAVFESAPEAMPCVQSEITQVMGIGAGEDAAHAEAAVARVRGFVSALTPDARRALLRIDPSGPEHSLMMLADLADVLPTEDVLDALGNSDPTRGRLSTNAIRLFKKMAHVATQQPAHRARVDQILNRWRGRDKDAPQDTSLHDALQEVFRMRSDKEYVPDDYRARLAGLSARPVEAAATSFALPAPADLTLHAAGIAVLVARDCTGQECAGVYDMLTEALPAMIGAGRLGVAMGAEIPAQATHPDPATGAAAARFVGVLQAPATALAAIRAAATNAQSVPHLERLLQPLGAAALDGVLGALASSPPEPLHGALTRFLSTTGGEALTKALRTRIMAEPGAAAALEPQLRALPAGSVLDILEPALKSDSTSVRRDAYSVASTALPTWPSSLVERAFRLEDPLVHALAFEKLSNQHDPASLNLLAGIVMRHGGYRVDNSVTDRAAAVLLNEGVSGLRLLSDALRQLCGEVRPVKAIAARHLSRLLVAYRKERCVRIALLRWRWCVARLVSAVRWR